MKVIDSSSLAKYVNREDNWEAVGEALHEGCVSLDLAVNETGNSLWKRAVRGELDQRRAQKVFGEFVASLPLIIAQQEELYVPSFQIAWSIGLPLYDALFIALARARGMVLVTSDQAQAEGARKSGVDVQFVK